MYDMIRAHDTFEDALAAAYEADADPAIPASETLSCDVLTALLGVVHDDD